MQSKCSICPASRSAALFLLHAAATALATAIQLAQPSCVSDAAHHVNASPSLRRCGRQVGHIPREVAALLAGRMDSVGANLRVEGFIPRGSGNVYLISVQLALYGPAAARPGVAQTLQQLQRRGERVVVHNPAEEAPPPPGAKKRKKAQLAPSASEIVERQLEDLYQTANKYEDMPLAEPPALVRTALFTHQKKALAWMRAAEARGTVQAELQKVEPAELQKVEPTEQRTVRYLVLPYKFSTVFSSTV
eukprot:SAG11_NODE_5226_length_1624_cov_2.116066_1_plen_248_part_00